MGNSLGSGHFGDYLHHFQQYAQQQPHHLQQQKHGFVRPNSVRFNRREIEGGGGNHRHNTFDFGDPKMTGGENEDQDNTGDEDDEVADDEVETADGGGGLNDAHIPMYGQAPPFLRHFDHGRNEDDAADEDVDFSNHAQDNPNNPILGTGDDGDAVHPADFGIHHVNMERNSLRRFQGSDFGQFQVPVPQTAGGARVF